MFGFLREKSDFELAESDFANDNGGKLSDMLNDGLASAVREVFDGLKDKNGKLSRESRTSLLYDCVAKTMAEFGCYVFEKHGGGFTSRDKQEYLHNVQVYIKLSGKWESKAPDKAALRCLVGGLRFVTNASLEKCFGVSYVA